MVFLLKDAKYYITQSFKHLVNYVLRADDLVVITLVRPLEVIVQGLDTRCFSMR